MVKYRKNIALLSILLLLASGLWGQRVSATVSKTKLSIQEQIQITFTFEDIKNSPRSIDLKLHDTFSIVGGPYSSTNYSWVNGKATSTNKVSYDITPKKSGKILIPVYEFKIKNHVYKTQPITLMISKTAVPNVSDPTSEMPTMFMETVLTKSKVYQGETFTLNYHLYTAEAVVNYTTNPLSTLDGFIVDRFDLSNSPNSSRKVINGKEYLIAGIATLTLTPTSTGKFIIPAKPFRISVKRTGKSRTVFDDPFFGTNTKDINIIAPSDTIMVLPLPASAGTAFTGAIGEFNMKIAIDSTLIQENQATALRIELSGHGNHEHFAFPQQIFPDAFEVFEPKVENDFRLREQDYRGDRSWEYVLIPSKPGTFQFEDISFTYFSLENGKYITLREPIPDLRVISHNELEGDYTSALSPDEVRLLSKDIRFIQMEETKIVDIAYDPVKNPWNWIFFYISAGLICVFIAMEIIWKFQKKNMKKIRYNNALKNALRRFNKITDEQEPGYILLEIETAFKEYLNDKQLEENVHKDIPDIIKTIETYKYAPGMLSHAQLNTLKDQILILIEDIEKE
ncbi:MAG: BatD family protein [Candidatus Marinimicrobia bacterium]|nr:BatD family protein [Candidatus Neomarinimicrobiota bacterium]